MSQRSEIQTDLIPHLFRTEFSKVISVLCRHFGMDHIEAAEDIASETFITALETWPRSGVPENPVGWLYVVAKNKARNQLHRDRIFSEKISAGISFVHPEPAEIDLSDQNIADSQLQMLFAICHPAIPKEAQIGLALRILCGFGIDEIATAFLTSKETINKRLHRAREKLRSENVRIEFPGMQEIPARLETVLTTLYLLFNEGYYSESQDTFLRKDLCLEAMRLAYQLIDNQKTRQPEVYALLALMCFHASRFEARMGSSGEIILYEDQDESLWNRELISRGAKYLAESAYGNKATKFHLEATIAYWHTIKAETPEKWKNMLHLYDELLNLEFSPIAALNRVYVFSKVVGKPAAIAEAEKLQLANNHFYFTLLGELNTGIDPEKAKANLQKALSLAKTGPEKRTIQRKIDLLY